MSLPRFDPSKAVHFDLAHGLVHLERGGHEGGPSEGPSDPPVARVLVPADAVLALALAAGPDGRSAFAGALGAAIGRRVRARLGEGGAAGASPEAVIEHLGGELALAGLGSLALERWGQALVLVVDHSPFGAAGDPLLEGVLAAAFAVLRDGVRALLVERDGVRARFLLGGAAGADKVRTWLAEGIPWGAALIRLHQRHEPAAPARGDA